MPIEPGTRAGPLLVSHEQRGNPLTASLPEKQSNVLRGLYQFPTAMYSVCVPATPPSVNVRGTVSLAAIFGTTTLN